MPKRSSMKELQTWNFQDKTPRQPVIIKMVGIKAATFEAARGLLRYELTNGRPGIYVQAVLSGVCRPTARCASKWELQMALQEVQWSKNSYAIVRAIENQPDVPLRPTRGNILPFHRRG